MNTYYKKPLILTFIVLVTFFQSFSQDFINEDFLDNIEGNASALWNENNSNFSSNSIPDKYKTESATVIGWRRSVNIDKKSRFGFLSKGERSLVFFENVRFKIRLNDKSAVEAFTTVYFRYSDKVDGFSARIIKPDGTNTKVSLNDAVAVESVADVPEFFKSFFDQQSGSGKRYFKVAVPDLSPGDILEYVTVTKSKLDVSGSGYIEFNPLYELSNKMYPVLFNQIVIETDEKSFFKSMSLNGAPDFKKETASDPGFFRYVFTDSERGVEKDVNFINTYKVYPLVKFQVVYANNEKMKGALIGEKGEIKSGFSKDELAKKAWEEYEQVGNMPYGSGKVQDVVNAVWSEFKKNGAKDWSEKKYISNVYYRLRNIVVNRDDYLPDQTAAYIFGSLLYQREIKSELLISISNSLGGLKDILFDSEIRYVCKVGNDLYFNFTDYSNPGELVESLLGNDAYILTAPARKGALPDIKPFKLPDASSGDNTANFSMKVLLTDNMNTLSISRTSSYKGISKNKQISNALKYIPYMIDDYRNYGGESPTERMRGNQEEEYYNSVKALKEKYKEAKPEFQKTQLQGEYAQKVKFNDFSLESDGRTQKTLPLVYTEKFDLPGMVRKAGKKYLVNIPGLVGSQLLIKKDERIRNHDIHVGYARSYNWDITFKVPEGYSVAGLNELNTKVDNEAGSYSCTAEENNGFVVVKISKVYKKSDLPKDKWNEMLAFVDAAYNTSFKYILLKPKN